MLYIGREEAVNMPLELATFWVLVCKGAYYIQASCTKADWRYLDRGLFLVSTGMMGSIDLYQRLRECSRAFPPHETSTTE